MVGLFKDEAGLRGSLQDGPLKACPDLDTLKTKMQRKKAGLMEVWCGVWYVTLWGGGGVLG